MPHGLGVSTPSSANSGDFPVLAFDFHKQDHIQGSLDVTSECDIYSVIMMSPPLYETFYVAFKMIIVYRQV